MTDNKGKNKKAKFCVFESEQAKKEISGVLYETLMGKMSYLEEILEDTIVKMIQEILKDRNYVDFDFVASEGEDIVIGLSVDCLDAIHFEASFNSVVNAMIDDMFYENFCKNQREYVDKVISIFEKKLAIMKETYKVRFPE